MSYTGVNSEPKDGSQQTLSSLDRGRRPPEQLTGTSLVHLRPETSSAGGVSSQKSKNHESILKELKNIGHTLRADREQPSLLVKPSWFDESLFENAKLVYRRHFMSVNFSHLSGLLLLVRIHSIYRTLCSTGRSDSVTKLFKRYYQTLIHVKGWYEGDIFDENSSAYRSLLVVRNMHNRASQCLNNVCPKSKDDQNGEREVYDKRSNTTIEEISLLMSEGRRLGMGDKNNCLDDAKERDMQHISEHDIMITQFAFIGFIVIKPKCVGLLNDFEQRDLESLLHFWRVIGYYLGASERFNLCSRSLVDVIGLCEAIKELEYKKSVADNPIVSPHGIMSVNIVRSLKFIPLLTIYGIMRYIYEMLDIPTEELVAKQTRLSLMSYTLIKFVLSKLLVYRPFRAFNNGITRLSVYLVGKIEGWFERHLESKYRDTLRL